MAQARPRDIASASASRTAIATIGAIGYEARTGYGVIGRVTNLASRLCAEAGPGEVLVSAPVRALVEDEVDLEEADQVNLKGFARPMSVYRATRMKAARKPQRNGNGW